MTDCFNYTTLVKLATLRFFKFPLNFLSMHHSYMSTQCESIRLPRDMHAAMIHDEAMIHLGSHLSLQHLPPTPEMIEKVDLVNEPDREVALPVPSSYSNRRIYKRD